MFLPPWGRNLPRDQRVPAPAAHSQVNDLSPHPESTNRFMSFCTSLMLPNTCPRTFSAHTFFYWILLISNRLKKDPPLSAGRLQSTSVSTGRFLGCQGIFFYELIWYQLIKSMQTSEDIYASGYFNWSTCWMFKQQLKATSFKHLSRVHLKLFAANRTGTPTYWLGECVHSRLWRKCTRFMF